MSHVLWQVDYDYDDYYDDYYDDDDYPNSVPERYRSVFFLHNWVDMPKELCPMFLAFDIMTKKWVKNCTGA